MAEAEVIMRASPALAVELQPGCPAEVDAIARDCPHPFLRAAWFEAAEAERTLLVRGRDGVPIAAFPLVNAGPPALGASAVAGSYWPFRSAAVSGAASGEMLRRMWDDPDVRTALKPFCRIGPFYRDDPGGRKLIEAAEAADWTVLTRKLGHTFLIDAELTAGPWPRPASMKKVRALERRLGAIRYERVTGSDWSTGAIADMAVVEQASWIAEDTDRSGAKFINPQQRAAWERMIRDPELAAMLSALILYREDQPIAFCFDLNVGHLQYSIAATFVQDLSEHSPGKVVTYRGIERALERGVTRFDWGAGDSGYKRKFGAVQGPEIIDCLFVRNPVVAAMLRPRWERAGGGFPVGAREAAVIASLGAAAAVAAGIE